MLVSYVLHWRAFFFFYRVSWTLVAVVVWPIHLCHVSWGLPTFTWKFGSTFWTSECFWVATRYIRMLLCSSEYLRMLLCSSGYLRMLLCSSWYLRMLLCSSWPCTWVHQTRTYVVFLVHQMHVKWIYGLCPWVVSFAHNSECC